MGWFGKKLRGLVAGSPVERATPRKAAFGISCPFGDLADISATGMRVRCHGINKPHLGPGDGCTFALDNGKSRIFIEAAVAWVKPRPGGGYYMGVRWTDRRPGLADTLETFMRTAAVHERVAEAPRPEPQQSPDTEGAGSASAQPAGSTHNAVHARVEVEDLYAILGVEPAADPAAISTAFRSRARELHPDVNRAPDAVSQMAKLNKAYSVLRDPELRRRYDSLVSAHRAAA
jgi:hypothetical protein